MGTMLQREGLVEADYRGTLLADHPSDLRGNHDLLALTRPDVVAGIHSQYLAAGADIVETSTFTATALGQEEYGTTALVRDINVAAAQLARAAADQHETADRPRYVAGVLGPTTRTASLSPRVDDPAYRNVTFAQLVESYTEAAAALLEGGADLLLVETIFDTLNAKAALFAIDCLRERYPLDFEVMISGTITDASGRTLSGQTVEAFWNSVRHAEPIAIGLNCALGAREMRPHMPAPSASRASHASSFRTKQNASQTRHQTIARTCAPPARRPMSPAAHRPTR